MTVQHTPGPWRLPPDWYPDLTIGKKIVCDCSFGGVKAAVFSNGHDVATFEVLANARLIAAAPEMLAVLAEYLVLGHGKCTVSKALADKALATVRKAIGEDA